MLQKGALNLFFYAHSPLLHSRKDKSHLVEKSIQLSLYIKSYPIMALSWIESFIYGIVALHIVALLGCVIYNLRKPADGTFEAVKEEVAKKQKLNKYE